jgi:hypothetical protein
MKQSGDLCWAKVDGVEWPCRVAEHADAPPHVIAARTSRHSVLVAYSFSGPIAWGWLAKSSLTPFAPRADSADQAFKNTMQHAIHKSRVNKATLLINQGPLTVPPPRADCCWFSEEGPYADIDAAPIQPGSAIKALREAAVQTTAKKALQALSDDTVLMLTSLRDNGQRTVRAECEEKRNEPEAAGPSNRGDGQEEEPNDPAPGPLLAEAAGPSLPTQLESCDARSGGRKKLRNVLTELKLAAICPSSVASKHTHTLLTGSSIDCLPVYRLREASKGSSLSLFGTEGVIMKLVLEETGLIGPSLMKLKPATLLERVKKEALKQEQRIQELQEIIAGAGAGAGASADANNNVRGADLSAGKQTGRKRQRDEQEVIDTLIVQGPAEPSSSDPPKKLEKGVKNNARGNGIGNGPLHVDRGKTDDEVDLDSILHELRRFEEKLEMSSPQGYAMAQPSARESRSPLLVELKKLKALLATIDSPKL